LFGGLGWDYAVPTVARDRSSDKEKKREKERGGLMKRLTSLGNIGGRAVLQTNTVTEGKKLEILARGIVMSTEGGERQQEEKHCGGHRRCVGRKESQKLTIPGNCGASNCLS